MRNERDEREMSREGEGNMAARNYRELWKNKKKERGDKKRRRREGGLLLTGVSVL